MERFSPRIDNIDVLERIALARAQEKKRPSMGEVALGVGASMVKSAAAYGIYREKMQVAREQQAQERADENKKMQTQAVMKGYTEFDPNAAYGEYEKGAAAITNLSGTMMNSETFAKQPYQQQAELVRQAGGQLPTTVEIGGKRYLPPVAKLEKPKLERLQKDVDSEGNRILLNIETGQSSYPLVNGKPYKPPRESLSGLIGAGIRKQGEEDEFTRKMKAEIVNEVPVYGTDDAGNKVVVDYNPIFSAEQWEFYNKKALTPARRKALEDIKATFGTNDDPLGIRSKKK